MPDTRVFWLFFVLNYGFPVDSGFLPVVSGDVVACGLFVVSGVLPVVSGVLVVLSVLPVVIAGVVVSTVVSGGFSPLLT